MRNRLFRCSIRVMFCVASLIVPLFAVGSGCGRLDSDPVDQAESDSAAVEQAATVSAEQAAVTATVVPGAKLEGKQLTALLAGAAAPDGVGATCLNIGTVCSPPINGIVRPCGGFTNVCDSSGTEDVIPINFICLPGSTHNVCTAVAGQQQQTIACTVPTEGNACSTGCGASFCLPYSSECDNDTNEVRNCFSNGVCSNDSCVNQAFTQQVVGTCPRDTEGHSCSLHGACSPPKAPLCNVNGICACLLGPQ
jgi:hypothetical protein